ncbi:hypothetical protein RY831_16955 [Noviherbaspirillum sp. CPCC 100848]|uniref:Uncharacterized protein n=1 Tax=Noviherbaspirillum album TaxID=3080276 RepID=A0ABU6JB35_9BURK|nr:hypothetical protein [Noviherbaspirillum sp. CPCC 100848]MEC4720857.1 hypothetical protein [Noviherbaspirillum sp. CPCC 100848]
MSSPVGISVRIAVALLSFPGVARVARVAIGQCAMRRAAASLRISCTPTVWLESDHIGMRIFAGHEAYMELIKPIKETLSERTHHQSANSNVLQKDADGISLGRYLAYRPANMGLRIEAFENLKIGIQKVHASMTACIDLYFCPAAVHMGILCICAYVRSNNQGPGDPGERRQSLPALYRFFYNSHTLTAILTELFFL